MLGLITSQNDTAPKLHDNGTQHPTSLITSQNGTAPKPKLVLDALNDGLITSQNDTAPKLHILFYV